MTDGAWEISLMFDGCDGKRVEEFFDWLHEAVADFAPDIAENMAGLLRPLAEQPEEQQ